MEGDTTNVPAYDCLVVIDLEATCDEGNPAFSRENQEVIEFPWVVVDLHAGVVCDRKQLFVRPEWTKEVSTFCTEKTGITNEKLLDAPYLADALAQFDMYVRENFLAKGKTFCIVTDGDWDIKVCLLQEARRKHIKLAPYFLAYFDVKQEFLKAYPQARKPSLKQMVDRLGIKFVGRPHSGLDDATNIASVVLKLLEYGHVFAVPDLISEDYDPANDPSFVDYNAMGGSKGPSIFSRLPEGSEDETTVVVIRGLPWSASEGEIEEFFGGAEGGVVQGGVHIINNKNGRPSGVGYVEFESQEFTKQALNKNNTYMGSRYIEVYLSDPRRMGAVLEGQAKIAERNVGTGNGVHIVGTTGPNGPSEDIRPGDWRCPTCNDHQFASRNACRKCGTAKPGLELPLSHHGFTGYGQPVQQPYHHHQPPFLSPIHMGIAGGQLGNGAVNLRPGDWHCPVCSDLNFASRKICRKCETPSPFDVAVKGSSDKWGWGGQAKESRSTIEIRPGDWHCPGCQDLNFASRRVCRKCGISNPTFAGAQPVGRPRGRGSYRPGDWYCQTCNHLNFASREVCRQCGSQPVDVDVHEDAASDQFGWQ